MSREFFVLYDYGQGGLWALVTADSEEQIAMRYPDVTIYREPPAGLAQDVVDFIRERQRFDIRGPEPGWLAGRAVR